MEELFFLAIVAFMVGTSYGAIPRGCTAFGSSLIGRRHTFLDSTELNIPSSNKHREVSDESLEDDQRSRDFRSTGNAQRVKGRSSSSTTQLVYDSIKPTLPLPKEISHKCRIPMDSMPLDTIEFIRAMMKNYAVCIICDDFDSETGGTCNTVGFCPQNSKCYTGHSKDRDFYPSSHSYDAAHPKAKYHGCCSVTGRKCFHHDYVVKHKNHPRINIANYTISTCSTIACNSGEHKQVNAFLRKLNDGKWASWGSWGKCSRTCGNGSKTRSRTCSNPKPTKTGKNCEGSSTSTQACHERDCPVDGHWTTWTSWGRCSVTCGAGSKSRSRSCTNPAPANGGKTCVGSSSDKSSCNLSPCPVNGQWSGWGSWGHCSVTCGGGTKSRQRSCSHPAPAHGGKICSGSSSMSATCGTTYCPVNGLWSGWGHWGQCSVTCGRGTKSRNRSCNHPAPSHGGKSCTGSSSMSTDCGTTNCPVDGQWASWTSWGSCSVTCGDGSKSRSRSCTHPAPANGGKTCVGSSSVKTACSLSACPIDGQWSGWGLWNQCTVTCGGGTKSRSRSCNQPAPSNGGKSCSGSPKMTSDCGTSHCPVNGHWNSWQNWGSCSVTCGHGTKTRVRTCSSVLFGGHTCSGNSKSSTNCGTPCSVDGHWSNWGAWGKCSVSCGQGKETRGRTCTNPPPSNGGKNCNGDLIDHRQCGQPCKVDGNWSSWNAWGTCSVTCGSGKESRIRTCSNPKPANGGNQCVGDSLSSRTCGQPCIVDGHWTVWQAWSTCSKSCASGTRSRIRTCTNPAPANGSTDCTGSKAMTETCNTDRCPEWSQWYYDACSVTCGNGTTSRLRHCSTGKDFDCGAGKAFERVACTEKPCPVGGAWGAWNTWSSCTATCGDGLRMRSRLCDNPLPQNGGADCIGQSNEKTTCKIQECAHWLPFTEVSPCSVTCGKGFRQMKRKCSTGVQTDCTGSAFTEETCILKECV